MTHRRLALVLALPLLAGCASSGGNVPSAADASRASVSTRARPLGALQGAARVVVLPTRYLVVDPRLGWAEPRADTAATLAAFDDELRFALGERGVGEGWVWPEQARRSAVRSAGAVPDVRRLGAEPLLRVRAGDAVAVPDPLASQLRALGALTDARYVLYPVQVTLAPAAADGSAGARATLHLALVDVRAATVEWTGSVTSAPVARWGQAVAAGVASMAGDLVAPRP